MGGRVSQPMGEKTGFPRRIPGSDVGVTPTLRAGCAHRRPPREDKLGADRGQLTATPTHRQVRCPAVKTALHLRGPPAKDTLSQSNEEKKSRQMPPEGHPTRPPQNCHGQLIKTGRA